jgi:hypothetical protein
VILIKGGDKFTQLELNEGINLDGIHFVQQLKGSFEEVSSIQLWSI